MTLGSDRLNSGNYLLRDVTRAEAFATPEHKEALMMSTARESAALRAEASPSRVGDSSPNGAVLDMRSHDMQDPQSHGMLAGFELVGDSVDKVGAAASRMAHNLSQVTGTEWGGLIYKDGGGKFHATVPISNEMGGAVTTENAGRLVPTGSEVAADYHSHPGMGTPAHYEYHSPQVHFDKEAGWSGSHGEFGVAVSDDPSGTNFSGDDKQNNDAHNIPGYLADPAGHFHKYTPPPQSDNFDGPPTGRTELVV